MVYNETGCGLNNSVCVPHFGLLAVRQTLRSLLTGSSQCDLDIGKIFLSFLLNNTMKEISGVYIQHVRSKEALDSDWENDRPDLFKRWCRNWMGLRDSPYGSIQLLIRLKIEAYNDWWDCSNPFH